MADSRSPKLATTSTADPAWAVAIRSRTAVLWIGRDSSHEIRDAGANALARLIIQPWAAVVLDASDIDAAAVVDEAPEVSGLPLRVFSANPPAAPPPNRVPIYVLPIPEAAGSVGAASVASLNRLQMLQRVPTGVTVFAVGVQSGAALKGLAEARGLSDAFRRVIRISQHDAQGLEALGIEEVTHWRAPIAEFLGVLDSVPKLVEDAESFLLRIRTPTGHKTVSLSGIVDQSEPITASFETIPLGALSPAGSASIEDLRALLVDATGSWRPYGFGVPFPRHEGYRREVFQVVERFGKDGPAATQTVWIPAQDGAGATTVLRAIAFDLAAAGIPVLVARPEAGRFGFHQLSTFLTRAGERFAAADVPAGETPWVICFDTVHSSVHWDFVTGAASGLKKLGRAAVVLAMRPVEGRADDARRNALGTNRHLAPALTSSVSLQEALDLGDHVNRFLPSDLHRSQSDWQRLIDDTIRTTSEGPRSLFWVALRFWLLRVPGTDESIGSWLSRHLTALTAGKAGLYATVLEVAALSKHRLAMPTAIGVAESLPDLRRVASDPDNLIGIARVTEPSGYAVSHGTIADELLRIAAKDENALAAVGMRACLGSYDLELHLLDRILSRDAIATEEGILLVEELVTAALRVDPREAPKNFQARDRIVGMLERIPDTVWDASQVLNHHVAKARRHLATNPPDGWSPEAAREQLELAEAHLRDAIEYIRPDDENRVEAPLNLQVSLALTFDARARLEHREGDEAASSKYRRLADDAYLHAQRFDADNSYVLENFARFKLNQLTPFATGEDRVRHIVDAIGLLNWELRSTGNREDAVLTELGRAYEILEQGNGRRMLKELALTGSEPALVALATLAMRSVREGAPEEEAATEAEKLLRRIPREHATGRSISWLYQIVSFLRPYSFAERLDLLEALEGDPSFPVPMQIALEHGILLFQVGDASQRKKGEVVFKNLRDQLSDRSGALGVPDELLFLRDPRTDYKERLKTAIRIDGEADAGRNYFGVPQGWGTVRVPARVHEFGPGLRRGRERDCYIRFTNFGPRAVPTTID